MTTLVSGAPLSGLAARTGPGSRLVSPRVARAFLGIAMAGAACAGALATDHAAALRAVAQAGPELTHLLRGMAVIKVGMAALASAVMFWRLGAPAAPAWLAGYLVAGGAMAAGPGLIWAMAHVRLGALFLHAGLLATVLLLWRDSATSARLSQVIMRRRQN